MNSKFLALIFGAATLGAVQQAVAADLPFKDESFDLAVAYNVLMDVEDVAAALGEQLSVYRERERAMNEALVAAQQLREETRAAAQREAQVIVREAEAEARRVVEEARAAQGEVQRQSADVERQFQAYVAGFRALLERQLAELRALDGQRGG